MSGFRGRAWGSRSSNTFPSKRGNYSNNWDDDGSQNQNDPVVVPSYVQGMDDGWDDSMDVQPNVASSTTAYRDNNKERSQQTNWRQRQWRNEGNGERTDRTEGKDGFKRSREWLDNTAESQKMTIQSRHIGKIIGKGGSKIRELEQSSGARIQIGEEDRGEAEITLVGNEESATKAKELIEELLYSQTRSYQANKESEGGNTGFAPIDWDAALKASDDYQAEKWAKCPPVKKDFYFEDPDVSSMHKSEVEQFRRENNNIQVSALDENDTRPIPNPVHTFEQAFSHYPEIMDTIAEQQFTKPSPIQAQAWPIVLQGNDLIGIAQTGTGKTIAFLLPALIHIEHQPLSRAERGGPNVLILAPTRELALQIESECKKYNYKGIKAVCVYGGGNRREQVNTVSKGVEIVIATPGRLNDLVMSKVIDVGTITYLVLDEADRMLDMGFEPQIRKVLWDIRPDRHTIMTSATWPEGVRRLAETYMKNPFQVVIGSLDLAAVHSVRQTVVIISDDEKRDYLNQFISSMDPTDKVIVFVGKKIIADHLASDLILNEINCQSIHGDREQCDREQALQDLKTGDVKILIATDVASRGIDIKDVTHIFNYDFPRSIEEYVHRVGRTGRAGRTGEAISLITRGDWAHAKELITIMEEANQDVPEELRSMAERYDSWKERKDQDNPRGQRGGGRGGGFRGGSSFGDRDRAAGGFRDGGNNFGDRGGGGNNFGGGRGFRGGGNGFGDRSGGGFRDGGNKFGDNGGDFREGGYTFGGRGGFRDGGNNYGDRGGGFREGGNNNFGDRGGGNNFGDRGGGSNFAGPRGMGRARARW